MVLTHFGAGRIELSMSEIATIAGIASIPGLTVGGLLLFILRNQGNRIQKVEENKASKEACILAHQHDEKDRIRMDRNYDKVMERLDKIDESVTILITRMDSLIGGK